MNFGRHSVALVASLGITMAACGSVASSEVSVDQQALAAVDCPASISLEVSGIEVAKTFDMSGLQYDCQSDGPAERATDAPAGSDPCVDFYTREVHEVAAEVRGLTRIPAQLQRQPTASIACLYTSPETVRGRVNRIEIWVDHGRTLVSAAYAPLRERTFGSVHFSAYPTRISASGVEFAPDTAASITDLTGPYSYSYVELGTAKINRGR